MTKNNRAALIGFLFALPFITTNFVVSLRLEPFYSFLGSFPFIRNSPLTPLFLLLFVPIGAFIALRPTLQKGIDGKRKFYFLNILLGLILIVGFAVISFGLGTDIYRCDILHIPNCD